MAFAVTVTQRCVSVDSVFNNVICIYNYKNKAVNV